MQSSHSLLTFPLHPLSMQLQAIHYSSLVISCLSLHPQQQIFPRASSYQLLKPTALSSWTSIQAGELFCLQVSSTSDEQQSENPTHFPCCCKQFRSFVLNTLPPLFTVTFSLAGSYFPWTHSFVRRPLIPRLKQSLVPRLSFYFAPLVETAQSSGFTSQPSRMSFTVVLPSSSLIQSLSQPHSSIPVWQPGYCHSHLFSARRTLPSHIPCYSDRQARKPTTT